MTEVDLSGVPDIRPSQLALSVDSFKAASGLKAGETLKFTETAKGEVVSLFSQALLLAQENVLTLNQTTNDPFSSEFAPLTATLH